MNFLFDRHALEALRDGRFEFTYGLHPLLTLAALLFFVGLVWLLYRQTTRTLNPAWKRIFITLRVAVLVLIFLILLRPAVTTWQVNPQETYLAVLIDDSGSMAVRDLGDSRRDVVIDALAGSRGILPALEENYQVRTFRFDSRASRVNDLDDLTAEGTDSWLGNALQDVDTQLGGLQLGAVVLISDGADSGTLDPVSVAQGFGARQVPVFTVGVGLEEIPRDVGIVDVIVDRTILDDTVFSVNVTVAQQGYAGETVELKILDGDNLAASKTVQLGPDGAQRRFEMELDPDRREPIRYQLEIEPLPDEVILENNRYHFMVDNSERPPLNILYVDGHPRNEFKFIRRSVTNDDNLRLASYLQTGPGRFYRQGLTSPLELSAGFPSRREDLYRYEAIILGDVSRDFFTDEQLGMIQDFVAERGGGLLVSGMMEDVYVDSRMADILPVTLVRGTQLPQYLQGGIRRGNHATGDLFRPVITREGELSPILRLDAEDNNNRRLWSELPELQGVYVTGRVKPGATVLMEHPVLQHQNQALPIIATQRYGAGRSMAITTASTWRWQMLMHSTDDSHERLWRQIMRWLTVSAPERIEIDFDRGFYHVGDRVSVTATVLDERFQPDNNASLWLQLSDPMGQVRDMPMEWDIDEDGVYRSSFEVESEGVYRVLLDAVSAGATDMEREIRSAFVVTPSLREFTDPALDVGVLNRIAQVSGGRYYPVSDIARLPDDLVYSPGAYSHEVREDIWDSPFLLFLLIALLSTDWALRRQKGLS